MRSQPATPATCIRCGTSFFTWPYKIRGGEGRYCSRKCAYRVSDPVEQFWRHVERTEGCWRWTGTTSTSGGYGRFANGPRGNSKEIYAHVFSYTIHFGPIPQGLFVCHTCDNPPCCKPDHLFAGTQAQNLADMVSKGRSLTGNRNPSRTQPDKLQRGERHHAAKLTTDDVIAIRHSYAHGNTTERKLATEFGVSRPTIHVILCRRTWTHVPYQNER